MQEENFVKKALVLLVAFMMLASFAACAAPAAPAAPAPAAPAPAAPAPAASAAPAEPAPAPAAPVPAPAANQTVTIMASQDWVKDPEMELAKMFTEETGINVDYQIIPSDQYPNLLTTRLNSGECADIFMHQSGKFDIVSLLQIEKNAVDLSGEAWVSRFDAAVKDQVSANGKVYGISIWDLSDSYAYLYNKTIFANLGLTPPTNYEEFKAVCQTLLDNGITPIYESVAAGWHHQLNFFDVSAAYDASAPGLIDSLNANQTTFAENAIFKTMVEQMKEIVDAGYWGEYYMSNVYEELPLEMAGGEYAMACNMMGRIADITAAGGEYTEEDFGIFPVPYLDNQVIAETPCGPSKFIYSGSANVELAKQYLDFLARQENLQYMIDNEASFNSLPFSGLTSTYSAEIQSAVTNFKTGNATVYQNAVIYLNPQWMEIGTDIASYLMGDIAADDVVAAIDQRRADQAAAASDPNWA